MKPRKIIDEYADVQDIKLIVADGFDEAIVGVTEETDSIQRVVYSKATAIEILMADGQMNLTEAQEYFDFNVAGSYIHGGPIYITKVGELSF
jgi:hypothetical protein